MYTKKEHLKNEVIERWETEKNQSRIARALIEKHGLENNVPSLARWVSWVIKNRGLLEECEKVGIPAEKGRKHSFIIQTKD